jgi:hypothetical protein
MSVYVSDIAHRDKSQLTFQVRILLTSHYFLLIPSTLIHLLSGNFSETHFAHISFSQKEEMFFNVEQAEQLGQQQQPGHPDSDFYDDP